MCWSSPQNPKQQQKRPKNAKEKGQGEMSRMPGKNKSWKFIEVDIYIYQKQVIITLS